MCWFVLSPDGKSFGFWITTQHVKINVKYWFQVYQEGKWRENKRPVCCLPTPLKGLNTGRSSFCSNLRSFVNLNIYNFNYIYHLYFKAHIRNFPQDAFCLSKNLYVSEIQASSDTPAGSSVKGENVIVFLMFIGMKGWVHRLSHNFLQIPRGRVVSYLSCLGKGKLSWLMTRRSLDSCPAIKLLHQWGCMMPLPPAGS